MARLCRPALVGSLLSWRKKRSHTSLSPSTLRKVSTSPQNTSKSNRLDRFHISWVSSVSGGHSTSDVFLRMTMVSFFTRVEPSRVTLKPNFRTKAPNSSRPISKATPSSNKRYPSNSQISNPTHLGSQWRRSSKGIVVSVSDDGLRVNIHLFFFLSFLEVYGPENGWSAYPRVHNQAQRETWCVRGHPEQAEVSGGWRECPQQRDSGNNNYKLLWI